MSTTAPFPLAPGSAGGRSTFFAFFIVILTAAATALSGNGSALPLDSHEVFVSRTAEEMIQRHSWIVPYLNDQPRIKKPPLSYWLVIAADRLNGGDGVVTELESRLPSIFAGIIMVGLTIALGSVLFNRAVGIIAGLLLAGSGAYVNYTHSARPEMLYAMLCTAGVLAFARSAQRHTRGESTKWFAWLGWLMMGLAILAKGPQLPLPIIGGWIIAMLLNGRRREIAPVLRPFSGALIMIAVSLWWYAALWKMLPNAWDTWQGETLTRYFSSREPKSRYLDPFYLYRTAQLMLPWSALFLLAMATPWIRELKGTWNARLLWWMILIPMIVLSISLGRRDYYMLPVTGIAAVLIAAVGVMIGRAVWPTRKAWLWRAIIALHVIAIGAAMIWMYRHQPPVTQPALWAVVLVTASAGAALAILLMLKHRPDVALGTAMSVGVIFIAAAALHVSLWQDDRFPRRDFCVQVRQLVPAGEPLLGWDDQWEVDQYYNHRVIRPYSNRDKLADAVRDSQTRGITACWLLVEVRDDPRRTPFKLPRGLTGEVMLTAGNVEKASTFQLWKLSAVP